MGAVYEGVHETTGEATAVKVLLGNLDEDAELRGRFEAEIDTLKRLRHPNVVRLFGFGEEQGRLYYVMELVDGPSLYQEIRRQRLFHWHEVAKIGLDICHALKHGHDRGITHRDIKPANILLDQKGAIKLSDYGIAHFFGGQRLTEIHSVVGTLEYMSPEQALANPIGPRSDLYSLGAVLYSLLVGRPPLSAKNLAEIVRKHQRGLIEPVRSIRLDTPDELELILLDLLKNRPEERPANAYLVAKRFQSLLQALIGPPESIFVHPMTPDSPTMAALEPTRLPPRGQNNDSEKKISTATGFIVERDIIDLGGIVESASSNTVTTNRAVPAPVVETGHHALVDSFGRPGLSLDACGKTIGGTASSDLSEKTVKDRLGVSPPSSHIRHGNLYLENTPPLRRAKDEPIPDFNIYAPRQPANETPPLETEKAEKNALAFDCDEQRIAPSSHIAASSPLGTPDDNPTVSGLQTDHRPEVLARQTPPAATMAGSQGVKPTSDLPLENSSRFVSVKDDDFDSYHESDQHLQPLISLQTVFASCCLILIGLVTFFMLQPAAPDVRFERILRAIETDDEVGFSMKALRQNEEAIDLFLLDHPQYPQADDLRYYLDQLELDKLERDIARRLLSTDARNMLPVQRAYMEAMSTEKTAPDRTVIKLKSLIDLFRSDGRLLEDEAIAQLPTPVEQEKPATAKQRVRGGVDEDFVFLASRQLERLERDIEKINSEQIAKLTRRLRDADVLEKKHPDRAATIRKAVIELYQDHEWATDVVQKAKAALGDAREERE